MKAVIMSNGIRAKSTVGWPLVMLIDDTDCIYGKRRD
jgi:hypothetical protein